MNKCSFVTFSRDFQAILVSIASCQCSVSGSKCCFNVCLNLYVVRRSGSVLVFFGWGSDVPWFFFVVFFLQCLSFNMGVIRFGQRLWKVVPSGWLLYITIRVLICKVPFLKFCRCAKIALKNQISRLSGINLGLME